MARAFTYTESLALLNDKRWGALSVEDKLGVLQSVENETARRENRAPCPLVAKPLYQGERGVEMGYYDPSSKIIAINSRQLEPGGKYSGDYMAHLDTVYHEGRHAYQDQAVSGKIKHADQAELEAWKENMRPGNYVRPEHNPRGYYNQPIEKDARAFAAEKTAELRQEQQQVMERQKALERQPRPTSAQEAQQKAPPAPSAPADKEARQSSAALSGQYQPAAKENNGQAAQQSKEALAAQYRAADGAGKQNTASASPAVTNQAKSGQRR